jgi:poly(3-hydroxybutyrate) depolymerase
LYYAYELGRSFAQPIHHWAAAMRAAWSHPSNPMATTAVARAIAGSAELLERATAHYPKPTLGLTETVVEGQPTAVRETVALESPFCRLLHFERDVVRSDPKLLIVAPLSGHHASLLRETVRELLPDHDLYLTDWIDARQVPQAHGRFDLNDYVDWVRTMLRWLGPGTHVLSVCQPAVPVLAALALMAAEAEPAQPSSVTLMSGPVDVRVNPTRVSAFGQRQPWPFAEAALIHRVPAGEPGAGRRVYPGAIQLAGFLSLDVARHLESHLGLFRDVLSGDSEGAARHRRFYDEYFAVMDLPAEFYQQTLEEVFRKHALARGEMSHRGVPVRLEAIRRTALMTIEGEDDEITGPGQTFAAHALCSGIPDHRKRHHLQSGAGHYGTFSGRRWRQEVAPALRAFIRSAS